jgi:alpha-L-rhamnosidase
MIFDNIDFITTDSICKENDGKNDPAVMLRKRFTIDKGYTKAVLYVAGLGLGYHYINGTLVSPDLFTPATSNYVKTVWYNSYDVTALLKEGDNISASLLGNGFYNESLKTAWNYDTAPWRATPRLIYRLDVIYEDHVYTLVSDGSWKVSTDCFITYNQLRSGEHFDSRKYDPAWVSIGYDDSIWNNAVTADKPSDMVFRELKSEPIRECGEYPAVRIIKTAENKYVFDLGQNISGYIRLRVRQKSGDLLIIHYVEQLKEDGSLELNKMDRYYKQSDFQTDRVVCNGKDITWSPKFVYHGFRYIEIEGLKHTPSNSTVTGIFVHQDIERRAFFECSDTSINRLYKMCIISTYSNLFHIPTDCPTREKLGWTNDARASCEQMLINFNMDRFYKKYMQDIYDAMLENGALPGIVPSSGWGYEWGSGPISSGILFEIPYRYYIYTSDCSLLRNSYPYFFRHLEYISNRKNENGFVAYGLCDWAGPYEHLEKSPVPLELTDTIMYFSFINTAVETSKILNVKIDDKWIAEKENIRNLIKVKYIDGKGYCTVEEQAALAMLICNGLYDDIEPLKEQLMRNIQEHDFHHYCGMLGLRYLYDALTKCSLSDYAYRIITATGYPSYMDWIIIRDATALCETFQESNSQNHHMWSDFIAWLIKNTAGIQPTVNDPGFKETVINTYFPDSLNYVNSYKDTPKGRVSVSWERIKDEIRYTLSIPEGVTAKIILQNAVFKDTMSNRTECTGGNYEYTVKDHSSVLR